MKKLSPLQVSQKLSQASGDKASLRWAKGQEARKAAQPKKPKVWNVTPFSKSAFSPISKWTTIRDPKTGEVVSMGGYYGDYTVPKGTQYSYQQKRKNLLGVIPRKPKTVSGTYKKDTTAPVLRYVSAKGNQYVLPKDVPTAGFDKTKIKTGGTGENEKYWKAVNEGQAQAAARRVNKSGASMSVSAFGVEHGGEIAKANYEPPNQDRGYRGGIGSGLNPRSKTYVKRGTAGARASRAIGNEVVGGVKGGVAGAVGGAALGALTRKPGAIKVGAAIGGNAGVGIGAVHGAQVGREKNIKSGDTMAFHRRTGAKAVGQHKLGPMSGMRRYGSTPLNNTL